MDKVLIFLQIKMSTMVSIKMVSRTVMVNTNGNQDLYILENFLME